MMEKRRIAVRHDDETNNLHYGQATVVNYNSSPTIGSFGDPDVEEKKHLYTKPRFVGILLSAIILVVYGMFVLSRTDIVHIALFHHTGDYHANNHVVDKIEEHKGIFIHDNHDIDAPPSLVRATAKRNSQASESSVNKVSKKNKEDPALLNALGFEEEEFVGSSHSIPEKKQISLQEKTIEQPSALPHKQLRQDNKNPDSRKSSSSSNEKNPKPVDSNAVTAVDSDPLKIEMEAQIAVVRKMKFQDHIVMEVDEKAKVEIAKLQDLVRRYIIKTYGAGPHYVEMELEFPRSMEQAGRQRNEKLIIELAPIDLVPYSVYYFLQLVDNWKSGAFHRRAGHVLQAFIAGGRSKTLSLAFQEYHPGFPHVKHTMGYAGRPGGPEFYISTVDNSENHGPGSQGSKTEADSCFGRIVKGFEVVERMKRQPGAGGAGFVDSPDNHIRIPSVRRIPRPEL